jgi:hypothetical protein
VIITLYLLIIFIIDLFCSYVFIQKYIQTIQKSARDAIINKKPIRKIRNVQYVAQENGNDRNKDKRRNT